MLNRRRFLALGGAVGGAVLIPRGIMAAGSDGTQLRPIATTAGPAPAPTPFVARMPVPPVAKPVASRLGTDLYQITIQPAELEILPGLRTPVLSYGGGFVGPTIRAQQGRQAVVSYDNRLPAAANVHLHGSHTPPNSDGHPMDLIQPGRSRPYYYPNKQAGATLWYHDHSHHTEAEHVYRGLHGFYLIQGEDEEDLRLPQGEYDVPIMIRDANIDETGQFIVGDPRLRTTILANGKPSPYFPVAARKYRFRLLNSASERTFKLSLGGTEFQQIGTDGGLLPAPVTRTELQIGSGERVEIVVDFARYPIGSTLVLDSDIGPVLRFDVDRHAADYSRVPDRLRALPALGRPTVTRDITMSFGLVDNLPVGMVNGQAFDPDRVDFQVRRGATEIWRIHNGDSAYGVRHNFHLHLEQFQVLSRNGAAPGPDDIGLKDTVDVPPNHEVHIQTTFREYTGRYVYHCHFLEHSSFGMMAQLEIVP